jgi:hypothetical protein
MQDCKGLKNKEAMITKAAGGFNFDSFDIFAFKLGALNLKINLRVLRGLAGFA